MAIFDSKRTSMAIEENHAEGLSSKRHEHHYKRPRKYNSKGHRKQSFALERRSDNMCWYREKEWEKKRLLFDVGVAVRKRFFEQSKAILPHRKAKEGPDCRIIREGNEACHRGDAIADAALFELGLLSGADNIVAYHDLYLCGLHQIYTSPQEFTKAIGYWASIATVDATTASERHRVEALECLTSITGLWNNTLTAEEFKASFVGNTSLYRLRELSRSIIRIDRGSKYRGYVEGKVDSGDVNNLEQSDGTEWG
ncbi:hypothetical protein DID88_003998 [Monilinia fructigena]|uniref:Uncharacterized protein n=1 Tax=Monilinia fructigena TaxID=38457 RepID=A0A395IEC5_9HELO|nr:hypothetical protein DID88_003998 [Monilinia fructigena]